jgi:DNA-3-methyladenine glycosylase I
MVPGPPARLPAEATGDDIPATTPVSDALSRDLKARGFRFVGSTIVYAFMQSVGLVDDHLPGCFRYGMVGVTR